MIGEDSSTGSDITGSTGSEQNYTVDELTSGSVQLTIDENDNLVASTDNETTEATEDSTLNFACGGLVLNVNADFSKSTGNFEVNIGNLKTANLTFSEESKIVAVFSGLQKGAAISISGGASDVLKVDVGIANLNRYFFGDGQFYNYANLADASTLDDENSIDENSIYNVIWTNSDSATIDFSESQTDEVLIFTNTNSRGDIVSLGGDYDDTIHAGKNDTIYGWNSTDYLDFDSIPNVSISNGNLFQHMTIFQ